MNRLRPLDLVNDRVHGHGDPMEPVCPESLSVATVPKRMGVPETETPGGLVMQGRAFYDCL